MQHFTDTTPKLFFAGIKVLFMVGRPLVTTTKRDSCRLSKTQCHSSLLHCNCSDLIWSLVCHMTVSSTILCTFWVSIDYLIIGTRDTLTLAFLVCTFLNILCWTFPFDSFRGHYIKYFHHIVVFTEAHKSDQRPPNYTFCNFCWQMNTDILVKVTHKGEE